MVEPQDSSEDHLGILVHLGKSITQIFEMLKYDGTSLKSISWNPLKKYRLPPLHPTTLLGDTRELGGHGAQSSWHISPWPWAMTQERWTSWHASRIKHQTSSSNSSLDNEWIKQPLWTIRKNGKPIRTSRRLNVELYNPQCWGGSLYFRLFNVKWIPWIPLLSAI